jgi:Pyruvate/2-oxoacid:ferredoxin oxidoreductase delta subunit
MMTGYAGILPAATWCPPSAPSRSASATARRPRSHIDAWLRKAREADTPSTSRDVRQAQYLVLLRRAEDRAPVLDLCARQSTFDEVVSGLDETNALFEARRCLSCGNCFECDNCYGVCPDNAVIKLGPGKRFEFNYDYCKGCGLCVAECPCGRDQDGAGSHLIILPCFQGDLPTQLR